MTWRPSSPDPVQPFYVIFDIENGRPDDYDAVYRQCHQTGGRHYYRDDGGQWRKLPHRVVQAYLPASDPEMARIAFELQLAQLDLVPRSIITIKGEDARQAQAVDVTDVPLYAWTSIDVEIPAPRWNA